MNLGGVRFIATGHRISATAVACVVVVWPAAADVVSHVHPSHGASRFAVFARFVDRGHRVNIPGTRQSQTTTGNIVNSNISSGESYRRYLFLSIRLGSPTKYYENNHDCLSLDCFLYSMIKSIMGRMKDVGKIHN